MRSCLGAAVSAALLLAGLLSGCRSQDWYEERAIARAREFLLENSPELSTEQRAFVRYNLPILLVEGIFGGEGSAISDASQICPAWVIPGCEDVYLVFGVSDIRMESWCPNRLIRKRFKTEDKTMAAAIAAARKYVQNGMYFDVTAHEFNSVRFEMPKLRRTDFEFSLNPDGTADGAAIERRKELTQFSLIWSPRGQENSVVVYGLAQTDLTGFAVYGGGVMSPDFLKRHILPVKSVIEKVDDAKPANPLGVSGADPTADPGADPVAVPADGGTSGKM